MAQRASEAVEEYLLVKQLAQLGEVSMQEMIGFLGLRYLALLETNADARQAALDACSEVMKEWVKRQNI